MGYTLTIGNAALRYDADDLYLRIEAENVSLPEAPAFGEPTDHTNARWPSYTGWSEFCREAGIEPLFYGGGWSREQRRYMEAPEGFHRERPLLASHPGAEPINEADVAFVDAALARRRETNGGKPAGFGDGKDHILARLEWLSFWMNWAVKNCAIPVVENT